MQVAQRCQRRRDLGVELDLGRHRLGRRLVEALAQQAQALHRVDGVHGPLERQVDVGLGEQDDRLVDDQLALVERELTGGGEHARQVDRGRPQLLTGGTGVDQERGGGGQGDRLAVHRRQPALDELGQVAGPGERAQVPRSSTTVSGSSSIGSVTQNEYGWAAMAKPTASMSAAMSSSSKSGTTRSVSPFAAMPPAKVTWPPAVTAPDVPRALSTSTASSGSRAIASRSASTAVLSGSPSSRSPSCSR